MRKVHIVATKTVPHKKLHEEDQYVAGTYSVTFNKPVDPTQAADAALDGFHNEIPVKHLDDFTFKVRSLEGEDLAVDHDHHSYSMTGVVSSIEQL